MRENTYSCFEDGAYCDAQTVRIEGAQEAHQVEIEKPRRFHWLIGQCVNHYVKDDAEEKLELGNIKLYLLTQYIFRHIDYIRSRLV